MEPHELTFYDLNAWRSRCLPRVHQAIAALTGKPVTSVRTEPLPKNPRSIALRVVPRRSPEPFWALSGPCPGMWCPRGDSLAGHGVPGGLLIPLARALTVEPRQVHRNHAARLAVTALMRGFASGGQMDRLNAIKGEARRAPRVARRSRLLVDEWGD